MENKNESMEIDVNNCTENDEAIARALQDNYVEEQRLLIRLDRYVKGANNVKDNNENESNYIREYYQDLLKQYGDKLLKEKLSFERFKNKLNSAEALPLKKKIKNFYIDFEEKVRTEMLNPDEQGQYMRDFITEITNNILENQLWCNCSKEEKESTILETEKSITKKLFKLTFAPSDDLALDSQLSHKIHMHSWIEPRHLDLPEFDDKILENASKELSKMNIYKFYIDKIICIANCMKLIELAYNNNISTEPFSNDSLISLLIYIILKTNPKHLISNIQYIRRYVNPNVLTVGIYNFSITNLWGSISYIKNISQEKLTISTEEYDENILQITRNDSKRIEEEEMAMNSNSLEREMGIFNDEAFCEERINQSQFQGIIPQDVKRNTSIESNGSEIISDYKRELRENYINNKNSILTHPFESQMTEEEKENLIRIDHEIRASLSIGSNVGRSESDKQ